MTIIRYRKHMVHASRIPYRNFRFCLWFIINRKIRETFSSCVLGRETKYNKCIYFVYHDPTSGAISSTSDEGWTVLQVHVVEMIFSRIKSRQEIECRYAVSCSVKKGRYILTDII